jgi:hypothetical protein
MAELGPSSYRASCWTLCTDSLISCARSYTAGYLRGICKPKVYTDGIIRYSFLTTTGEPENLQDALQNNNWREVMNDEILALEKTRHDIFFLLKKVRM